MHSNWKVENLVKSQSGHAEKPFADHMWPAKGFSAWPLCHLTSFFDFQSFLMMVGLLVTNTATWEWFLQELEMACVFAIRISIYIVCLP